MIGICSRSVVASLQPWAVIGVLPLTAHGKMAKPSSASVNCSSCIWFPMFRLFREIKAGQAAAVQRHLQLRGLGWALRWRNVVHVG